MYFKKLILFVTVILSVFVFTGCINTEGDETVDIERITVKAEVNENVVKSTTQDNTIELIEKKLIEIEEQFFDMLFKPEIIESSYEIKNYQSKKALIEDASQIADIQLVSNYVDYYYSEEDDKLYVIPTESPVRILPDYSYDFRQIDENTYEVIQDEGDEMVGSYRLTVKFTRMDNRWKMTDRRIELRE